MLGPREFWDKANTSKEKKEGGQPHAQDFYSFLKNNLNLIDIEFKNNYFFIL